MKKILIVEDNEKNRILVRDILQHFGYETIEAINGEEGIRMTQEHKPDLILMDMQMPVMDGFKAIKALRADPGTEKIKIIAVTSFSMKGDREKAIEAGADDYLSKPINTRNLIKVVRRILGEEEKGGGEER
jgi:two-component system cell cycle response regulator DivK